MSERGKKRSTALLPVVAVICFSLLLPFLKASGEVAAMPATVRVGMLQHAEDVPFKTAGKYQLVNRSTGQIIANIRPNENWTVSAEKNLIKVARNGEQTGAFQGPVLVREVKYQISILSQHGVLEEKGFGDGLVIQGAAQKIRMNSDLSLYRVQTAHGVMPIQVNDSLNLISLQNNESIQHLRGDLEFRLDGEGITVVNELPLEKYLCGVVPGEMYVDWPLEALKAQAVAARTYVLRQMGSYSAQGFDVLANQYNQVYRGYDWETPSTNRAVEETVGLVATYHNKPVTAFYHSSSGGHTEDSEDVWRDKLPYIRGKEDLYDQNAKHYGWGVTLTQEEILARLNQPASTKQQGEPGEAAVIWSEVKDIKIVKHTSSGQRVQKVKLTGRDQDGKPVEKEIFNADGVRRFFGLKSALFTLHIKFDSRHKIKQVTFEGDGLGHGLGMSQYGARAMAEQGYTFQDILQYYYTGIEIKPNYGQ